MLKIEEMEKMLKEAQLEKARLIESRVRTGPDLLIDESSRRVPANSFEVEAQDINGRLSFIFISLRALNVFD